MRDACQCPECRVLQAKRYLRQTEEMVNRGAQADSQAQADSVPAQAQASVRINADEGVRYHEEDRQADPRRHEGPAEAGQGTQRQGYTGDAQGLSGSVQGSEPKEGLLGRFSAGELEAELLRREAEDFAFLPPVFPELPPLEVRLEVMEQIAKTHEEQLRRRGLTPYNFIHSDPDALATSGFWRSYWTDEDYPRDTPPYKVHTNFCNWEKVAEMEKNAQAELQKKTYDSSRIMNLIRGRLQVGLKTYGQGVRVADDFNWHEMAVEELLDAVIYLTAAVLRERDSR